MAAEESTAWPGGVAADVRGRARLRLQVEHGLDARHARLLRQRPGPPQLPPRRAHVQPGLRLHRELHAARCRTTRSCTARGRCCRKMPGDDWQKLANLRALYGYMWAHPGKKLLFMGGEFAQEQEWSHERSLDWHLLERPRHAGVQRLVRDLNQLYRGEPALWERDSEPAGFGWLAVQRPPTTTSSPSRATRRRGEGRWCCAANLSPVPRRELPPGHAARRALARGAEHRRARSTAGADLGNLGGVDAAAGPVARAARLGAADAAAARRPSGSRPMTVGGRPRCRGSAALGAHPPGDGYDAVPRLGSARARRSRSCVRAGAARSEPLRADGVLRGAARRPRPGDDYRYVLDGRRSLPGSLLALSARGRARALARGRHRRGSPGPTQTGPASPATACVIYELHVGTFTPEGTFDAAVARLASAARARRDRDRADAGRRVPGRAQLGLRRRLPVAPHPAYGGPRGARRARRRGPRARPRR